MTPLRNLLLAAGAAVLLAPGVWAFDYGAALSNDSSWAAQQETSFSQINRVSGWITTPAGDDAAVFVSGFGEFRGAFSPKTQELGPLRFDLGRSEFEGSLASAAGADSMLRWAVGRTGILDFSGRLISGLSDGARAELSVGNLNLTAAAGYRGLLNKNDSNAVFDADDRAVLADEKATFGPPRAFAGLGVRTMELVKGHDLGLEAWAQFDLSSQGTVTNTQYLEPFVEGRIGRTVRWRGWAIAEFGQDGASFGSAAAGAQVRLSVPEWAGLRLTQSATWACGAAGGLRAFTPIRQLPVGSFAPYPFSDTLSLPFDATFKPLPQLTVSALACPFFRTTDTPPSGGGTRADTAGQRYLGAEAGLRLVWPVAIDLSLGASAGLFLPNTATLYPADFPARVTAALSLTLET